MYGDEPADAGCPCRTRLARRHSQALTGTGKYYFSLFQDWQPYRLIPTLLLYVMTINTNTVTWCPRVLSVTKKNRCCIYCCCRIGRIGWQPENLLYNVANSVGEAAKAQNRRIVRSYYIIYYPARSVRLNYLGGSQNPVILS